MDEVKKVNKPVALKSLKFYDKSGTFVLSEEYGLIFNTYEYLEKFIQSRHKYWTEFIGKPLYVDPYHHETLQELEIVKVQMLVCEKMGIPYSSMMAEDRQPRLVEARRMAMNICINRGQKSVNVARVFNMDHSSVSYHRKKHKDFLKVDREYEKEFNEIEDYVLTSLNGKYSEDGSGVKLKENEKAKDHPANFKPGDNGVQ